MARDLDGRTFVVTGASAGIGRATSAALAARGGRVIMACRDVDKAGAVAAQIRADSGSRVEVVALDLADLESVRRCGGDLASRAEPLHVLVNNAGIAGTRGVTKDGFELTFGTNHLGHFLLTALLLDKLADSAPARVVHVASRAHYQAARPDWASLRSRTQSRTGVREYRLSKLCNVLFSNELATRLDASRVRTYALHPGVVASDLWRALPGLVQWLAKRVMISNEEGAATSLHCAASSAAAHETGLYYHDARPRTPSALARDAGLARELWARSEEWTRAPASRRP
jgi:retinol dehydrogenase 12